MREEIRHYYDEVAKYTNESWIAHFDKINPKRLVRSNKYHLDHIYSIFQGFKEGISPEIIGHWTNLRMLSKSENSGKKDRCDKTKEQLLEDFNKY